LDTIQAVSVPSYRIRRSARARHVRLTVTPEGEAVVVMPPRAPLCSAAMLVEQHAIWLKRQLDRRALELRRLDARPPLGQGRTLTINGIEHDVVIEHAGSGRGRGSLRRQLPDADGIRGALHVSPSAARGAKAVLEAWLRGEARRILTARVSVYSHALGVTPGRMSVRGQRSRWGSASRDGSLSFNWRLVLAPPFVLDSVVVHELAHLRLRRHSRAFWTLVRRQAPRTEQARTWLRANHRELLAALD
jgi:predicted metal-dependent hydrolase